MQTFLPYPDFHACAVVLDRQRLGKQRVEVLQLLNALAGKSAGWRNHPAAKMWRGHEHALIEYGRIICIEWIGRGYQDTRLPLIEAMADHFPASVPPPWLGMPELHESHKANLVRKLPGHYGELWPDVVPQEGYYWPV